MELLLVRHGEAVPVLVESEAGSDPPLTEAGREQARRLAEWLQPEHLTAIVASTSRRATETADALSKALRIDVDTRDDLWEYDRGALTYIPAHMVDRTDPAYRIMLEEGTYLPGPDGEDPEAFRRRAVDAIEAVVGLHAGGRVAAVCHGGVINAYLGHVLGIGRLLWFNPDNTSVSRVAAARTGQRTLLSLNETGHLVGHRPS